MSESDRIDYSSDSSETDENTDTRPSSMEMDTASANLRRHSKSCCTTTTIAVCVGGAAALILNSITKTKVLDSGNPGVAEQIAVPPEDQVSIELTVGMDDIMDRRKLGAKRPVGYCSKKCDTVEKNEFCNYHSGLCEKRKPVNSTCKRGGFWYNECYKSLYCEKKTNECKKKKGASCTGNIQCAWNRDCGEDGKCK